MPICAALWLSNRKEIMSAVKTETCCQQERTVRSSLQEKGMVAMPNMKSSMKVPEAVALSPTKFALPYAANTIITSARINK